MSTRTSRSETVTEKEEREAKVGRAKALGVDALVVALWDVSALSPVRWGGGDVFAGFECDPEAILDDARPGWRDARPVRGEDPPYVVHWSGGLDPLCLARGAPTHRRPQAVTCGDCLRRGAEILRALESRELDPGQAEYRYGQLSFGGLDAGALEGLALVCGEMDKKRGEQ